jgi:outer membrane biosynthesis protein TonB
MCTRWILPGFCLASLVAFADEKKKPDDAPPKPKVESTRSTFRITTPLPLPPAVADYIKKLKAALGTHWKAHMDRNSRQYAPGSAKVAFSIEKDGSLTDVRTVSNTSNPAFANMCIEVLRELEPMPLPAEAEPRLRDGKLPQDFTFTVVQP